MARQGHTAPGVEHVGLRRCRGEMWSRGCRERVHLPGQFPPSQCSPILRPRER